MLAFLFKRPRKYTVQEIENLTVELPRKQDDVQVKRRLLGRTVVKIRNAETGETLKLKGRKVTPDGHTVRVDGREFQLDPSIDAEREALVGSYGESRQFVIGWETDSRRLRCELYRQAEPRELRQDPYDGCWVAEEDGP